jgi:hypothetical protein
MAAILRPVSVKLWLNGLENLRHWGHICNTFELILRQSSLFILLEPVVIIKLTGTTSKFQG